MPSIHPRVITKSDPTQLVIEWDDDHKTRYTARELRGICPCANCVNELTGQRMHDPESVPADLETRDVSLVGHYALTIAFSDSHSTGIFPFAYLRERDPGSGRR
jgi:DUF971 family protein